ncbi:hypothetical protein ABZP36_008559 [Zizania latifolia]
MDSSSTKQASSEEALSRYGMDQDLRVYATPAAQRGGEVHGFLGEGVASAAQEGSSAPSPTPWLEIDAARYHLVAAAARPCSASFRSRCLHWSNPKTALWLTDGDCSEFLTSRLWILSMVVLHPVLGHGEYSNNSFLAITSFTNTFDDYVKMNSPTTDHMGRFNEKFIKFVRYNVKGLCASAEEAYFGLLDSSLMIDVIILIHYGQFEDSIYFGDLPGPEEEVKKLEMEILLKFTRSLSDLLGLLASEGLNANLSHLDLQTCHIKKSAVEDLKSISSRSLVGYENNSVVFSVCRFYTFP